jgi:pimeloyl-ACP methyl ester carboxylesterase
MAAAQLSRVCSARVGRSRRWAAASPARGFALSAELYRSLAEADEVREPAADKLTVPVLAVAARENSPQEQCGMSRRMTALTVNGIGHYVAMEAPERLADALVGFTRTPDGDRSRERS